MARKKVNKRQKIKEFRAKIKIEEERIENIIAKKVGKLRYVDTMKSDIIPKRKTLRSYEQVRQQYYRMKRIDEKNIEQRIETYSFDNYIETIRAIIRSESNYALELSSKLDELKKLTQRQKRAYISEGLNRPVAEIYIDFYDDIRFGNTSVVDELELNIEYIKENY